MSRYIIKNCPSCRYTPKRYIDGIDYICWNAQNFNSSVRGLCQDCTDCVMKQIVEKCKNIIKCDNCELNGKQECIFANYTACYVDSFAKELLQLLDIEEAE